MMIAKIIIEDLEMTPSDGAHITFDPKKVGKFEELLTWKN